MSDTLRLTLLTAGFVSVGIVVSLLAGLPARREWLSTIVGVAPATGIAVFGLAAACAAMVGLDVGVLTVGAAVVIVLALGWAASRSRRPSIGALRPPDAGLAVRALELAFVPLYALLSYSVIRFAAATGLDAWDGWAIWAPKAHALYAEGDVWGPVFRSPEYSMQHQEYPILLPSLEALSADAIGRFDPYLADIGSALLLVSFGCAAWALMRLVVTPPFAALVALAVMGSGPLVENAGANYADSAVASFTALGLLSLLLWLREGGSPTLVLAALFFAAAAATKSEGLMFAVAAIVAAAVLAGRFGRSLGSVIAFAAAVLAVPVLWAVVDRLNGAGAKTVDLGILVDPGRFLDALDRIPTATARLAEELADAWPLALLIVLVGVAAACMTRQWWPALFVGLWSVLGLGGLVTVYFLSVNPIEWHLATSADRVVFSPVLAAAVCSVCLIGLAWRSTDDRPERSSS